MTVYSYTGANISRDKTDLSEYEGNVRNPGNMKQCWAVVRIVRKRAVPPFQCTLRRKGPSIKGGKRNFCCHHHSKLEADAELLNGGPL